MWSPSTSDECEVDINLRLPPCAALTASRLPPPVGKVVVLQQLDLNTSKRPRRPHKHDGWWQRDQQSQSLAALSPPTPAVLSSPFSSRPCSSDRGASSSARPTSSGGWSGVRGVGTGTAAESSLVSFGHRHFTKWISAATLQPAASSSPPRPTRLSSPASHRSTRAGSNRQRPWTVSAVRTERNDEEDAELDTLVALLQQADMGSATPAHYEERTLSARSTASRESLGSQERSPGVCSRPSEETPTLELSGTPIPQTAETAPETPTPVPAVPHVNRSYFPKVPPISTPLARLQSQSKLSDVDDEGEHGLSIARFTLDSARSLKSMVIRQAWIVQGTSPLTILVFIAHICTILLLSTALFSAQRSLSRMENSLQNLELQVLAARGGLSYVAHPDVFPASDGSLARSSGPGDGLRTDSSIDSPLLVNPPHFQLDRSAKAPQLKADPAVKEGRTTSHSSWHGIRPWRPVKTRHTVARRRRMSQAKSPSTPLSSLWFLLRALVFPTLVMSWNLTFGYLLRAAVSFCLIPLVCFGIMRFIWSRKVPSHRLVTAIQLLMSAWTASGAGEWWAWARAQLQN